MKGTLLSTYVENISTRKDKSVKITLGTQELSPEKAGELFQLMNQLAVTYICPTGVSDEEINQVDAVNPDIQGKSQSHRMRNVLFLLWKQSNDGFSKFDDFYKNRTEKIIDQLKSKLQPF